MTDRPNILLLLTDQQSATMMSCAGNPHVRTPAMDSLAATGVRFGAAYCTNPICLPSRFSLMTGRMPSALGIVSNRITAVESIPDEVRLNTLGNLLRRAGYETGYGGKLNLPRMSAADAGFEPVSRDERQGLAAACGDFILRPRRQPFFLMASFVNPHDICYMALRDFGTAEAEKRIIAGGVTECRALDAALERPPGVGETAFFDRVCPPLPPNFEPQEDEPEALSVMLAQRPFRALARAQWSARRWREHRWAYARLTEQSDRHIGCVLQALEASGQRERTLVLFTSDHGDMDASHRLEHKSTFYDEACRVPLIVRPPGGAAARVEQGLVSNGLDLLPTVCDWAGIAPPPELAGRSLRPVVEGPGGTGREVVPIEGVVGRAVVTSRLKYARYDFGERAEQLVDRMEDPGEMRNRAGRSERREDLQRMRRCFDACYGDQPRPAAEELLLAARDA